ncbi:MAG: FAD:protein FMN transferase [Burkholderiaceae bacterium]|nr:FAD:protein FMN transferase [Burkholderiaceae bacterium]
MDTLISPHRRTLLQALACSAFLTACGRSRLLAGSGLVEFNGLTMGSTYRVHIVDDGIPSSVLQAARVGVESALNAVDFAMSTHRPQSELSQFNRHALDSAYPLSADMADILALSARFSELTNGAFDVTVGPVVDAWGFGGCRHRRIVGDEERRLLERTIGWRKLVVDSDARTATKADPSLRADLSGIAKGYGVDKAAQVLDMLGVRHYLIDTGGEVRTKGTNAEGKTWQVAIEQPEPGARRPRFVVPLSGMAIATSGDYRIFFEQDGRRFCHEINPATGLPIDNHLASVSVIAATGAEADALGKLIVLGLDRGYALATSQNIAAHFITRNADGSLRDVMTPAFQALGGAPYMA